MGVRFLCHIRISRHNSVIPAPLLALPIAALPSFRQAAMTEGGVVTPMDQDPETATGGGHGVQMLPVPAVALPNHAVLMNEGSRDGQTSSPSHWSKQWLTH